MLTDTTPPLDPKQPLNNWLLNLDPLGCQRAGKKLYEVLQSLYRQDADVQADLALLNTLSLPVISYADELERLALAGQPQISPELARKTATLSCQLLRLLALNYCKLSASQALTALQPATIAYTALQLIGRWFYKLTVLKQCPSRTLWQKTAELYLRAQKYQLLNQPVAEIPFINCKQRTIFEVLQRNLLFALCEPYRFNSEAVNKLFDFADNYHALLHIADSELVKAADYAWSPRQAEMPMVYVKKPVAPPQMLYLNCQALAALLATQKPLVLPPPELDFLQQHFNAYKNIIDSAVHTMSSACKLVLDFPQIHAYLSHCATIKNIQRVSMQNGEPQARTLLQLAPLNAPPQPKKLPPEPTLTPEDKVVAARFSVHPTRFKNYFMTTVANLPADIDIPLLFVEGVENIRLGIIRQITPHPLTRAQQILIEHLPGAIESVQVTIDKTPTAALLIKQADDLAVLLPPGPYQGGMVLALERKPLEEIYVLGELRQFKPSYMYFNLVPG